MAQFFVDEQPVTYAAVDPETFWRYTVPGTAHTAPSGSESPVARSPSTRRSPSGSSRRTAIMRLGNETDARAIHIGAWPSCSTRAGPGRSTRS